MKNVEEFCLNKMASQHMTEAFKAYVRSVYALKLQTRSEGETTKMIVSKMDEDELNKAWLEFTADFKKFIES